MMYWMRNFWRPEDGAVTVDWVVLTGALVGLGIAVRLTLEPAMTTQSGSLNRQLGTEMIKTEFPAGEQGGQQ
ncbi:MAG: pilus assembly protein [Pseudomonadota bacterium]